MDDKSRAEAGAAVCGRAGAVTAARATGSAGAGAVAVAAT